jgi:hypothetical protein
LDNVGGKKTQSLTPDSDIRNSSKSIDRIKSSYADKWAQNPTTDKAPSFSQELIYEKLEQYEYDSYGFINSQSIQS